MSVRIKTFELQQMVTTVDLPPSAQFMRFGARKGPSRLSEEVTPCVWALIDSAEVTLVRITIALVATDEIVPGALSIAHAMARYLGSIDFHGCALHAFISDMTFIQTTGST